MNINYGVIQELIDYNLESMFYLVYQIFPDPEFIRPFSYFLL